MRIGVFPGSFAPRLMASSAMAPLPQNKSNTSAVLREVRRLDPEPHDVKMDHICTEIYTYDCAKKQTK